MNKHVETLLHKEAGRVAYNITKMAEERVAKDIIFDSRRKSRREPIISPTNDVYAELCKAYQSLPKGQRQALIYAIENGKTIQNILRIQSKRGVVTFERIK